MTGQNRTTQRHRPASTTPQDSDAALREWQCGYAWDHPRREFRPVYHEALAEGWILNHNKVQRLWPAEGLRVSMYGLRTFLTICRQEMLDGFWGLAPAPVTWNRVMGLRFRRGRTAISSSPCRMRRWVSSMTTVTILPR